MRTGDDGRMSSMGLGADDNSELEIYKFGGILWLA